MTQPVTEPYTPPTLPRPRWRLWWTFWIIAAAALLALLSFNARLDTFLWCSTRWAAGDDGNNGRDYAWVTYKAAHAGDADKPFYMTADPPMQSHFYLKTRQFWEVCKKFGEGPTTIILGILIFYFYQRRRLMVFGLAAGSGIAGLLGWLIRSVDGRYRPTHYDGANHWELFRGFHNGTDLSFPSGHSTLAFATAAALSYLFPKGRYLFIFAALCTAASRVVQEAHFWSDALLGAALGWSVTWFCMRATDRNVARITAFAQASAPLENRVTLDPALWLLPWSKWRKALSGPLTHPVALLLLALWCIPLFFLFLGSGHPTDMMELFNLVPVREAYRDGHWLMPTLGSVPRFEKPPLAVWIPAGLVQLLHSDSLWILRLPSAILGTITTFATYGMGCLIFQNPADSPKRHRLFALLAAAFVPVIHLINHQARLASYDIYAATFCTVSVFFLLKLTYDSAPTGAKRVTAGRWLLWTSLAGVALGLSLMSKGPAPPATVLVPFLIWLLLFHRRRGPIGALVLASLIAVLVAVPWVAAVSILDPRSWEVWSYEAVKLSTARRGVGGQVDKALRDPFYYYLQMLIWVMPLTPTLIAGLVMPFLPAKSDPQTSSPERQGRWLCWIVLILGLVLLTLPAEKKMRYTVQLAPFACLLCAAVWQEFIRLRRDQKIDPAAGIVLWSQALFFIGPGIAGLLISYWVMATSTFFQWPQVDVALDRLGPLTAMLLSVALLLTGIHMLRLEYRRKFLPAAWLLAFASFLLMFTIQCVYHAFPGTLVDPARAPAEAAIAATHNAPIYSFHENKPWIHTLFNINRPLHVLEPEELAALANQNPQLPLYLIIVTANADGRPGNDAPSLGAAQNLALVESQSHRTWKQVGQWLDENRHTALLELAPSASPPSK